MKKDRNINIHLLMLFLMLLLGACRDKDSRKENSESKPAIGSAEALTGLGNEQWRMGNYQEALKCFAQAYTIARSSGNEQQTATLLNNLGLVHWRLGNNDPALECYNEAARMAETLHMRRLLGLTHTNRALILKEERHFAEAFRQNNSAIAIFKELREPKDLATAYNNQGQIYRFSNRPEQALAYYGMSLKESQKIKHAEGMATAYQNLSTVYAAMADPEKAYFNARMSLALSRRLDSKVRISEACRELAAIHEQFSRPDSALYYFKKHYESEKKLMDARQSDRLSRYQAKMGVAVKNLRIRNLQIERQIADSRLGFLAIGIFMVLLTVSFLLYRYFSKMRFKKAQLETALENSLKIIEVKEQELKTYIIDLSRKNTITASRNATEAVTMVKEAEDEEVAHLLGQKILTEEDWRTFKIRFCGIYPHFFGRISDSDIAVTEAEVRILVLMRLNLKSTDMAGILGISPQSVRVCKMRLKKKLLTQGYETVESFLQHIIKNLS